MSADPELIVLGAGPAGIGAALSAAECGVRVLVLDEDAAGGGQVYRAMPESFRMRQGVAREADAEIGEQQRGLLRESSARTAFGRQVWSVAPGYRVEALGPSGPESWDAKALVVATGTSERVVPFPGWTLPGVIGLAGATLLLKAQQTLPGERTVVAGCGPLLAAVASGIIKAGGRVAALADLSGPADWMRALPSLAGQPRLLLRGAGWLRRVRRAGAPILFRHTIREVRGAGNGLAVELAPVDRERGALSYAAARRIEADAVAVGHGLIPATEVTRLLGAEHVYRAEVGGWVPVRDSDGRTSRAGLYVAGDGAGISGAAAAHLEGRLAGLAAALDLGRLSQNAFAARAVGLHRRLRWAAQAGQAMARLMALRPKQVASVPPEVVVCRCEDVTRGEIDAAIADGARDLNQLKAWTRCGMGPCQGRMCGETAASLLAAQVGGREMAGTWTPRVPLRPVRLDRLIGDYGYGDIPAPAAAPL